ncbi:MAG: STAS domain-containing protein [Thermoanaerobaculia bacterium]|nr:STAS domain-containing protein [Thermoanaerobaculia bacterium]
MIVEKKNHGDHTVLRVEGVVRMGESAQFLAQTLDKLLAEGRGNVLVDLERINYIDSTGIGELVGYFGRFKEKGRRLILVKPADRIRKLLEIARLDAVFPTYSELDEAIAAECG